MMEVKMLLLWEISGFGVRRRRFGI